MKWFVACSLVFVVGCEKGKLWRGECVDVTDVVGLCDVAPLQAELRLSNTDITPFDDSL